MEAGGASKLMCRHYAKRDIAILQDHSCAFGWKLENGDQEFIMSSLQNKLKSRRGVRLFLAISMTGASAIAFGKEPTPNPTPQSRAATDDQAAAGTSPAPPPTALAETAAVPSTPPQSISEYDRFDELTEPGLTTNFPGSRDSVFRDTGGVRTWLADHDIGIQSRFSEGVIYNPLDTGQPRSPQRYNGQRLTLIGQVFNAVATVGLAKVGLPNSRFIVGGTWAISSFEINSPNIVKIRNLAYYQSFFDKTVELKVGIFPNSYEFVGLFTGGNPVLAAGFGGLIPIQAGLSADPAFTPTANITIHMDKDVYVKVGFQRSVSPRGAIYEANHNGIGLKFSADGAGLLTIGEVGIRRPATRSSKQIWLRMGGMYNGSDYSRFDGDGTSRNISAYAAADVQVTKRDTSAPAQGFYVGGSAFWADPKVTAFTQTYEGRIYDVGVLSSRPTDTAALRVGYTRFSSSAYRANLASGAYPNKYQVNVTGSYSAHVHHGIYLTPAIAYIRNPSFIGKFKDAALISGTLYLLL